MNGNPEDRRHLTFAQAEGAEALPQQLRVGELSQPLRAQLWRYVFESLKGSRESGMYGMYISGIWKKILYDKYVFFDHEMADEFETEFGSIVSDLKTRFEHGNYVEVLGLVQFVLRHPSCPRDFPNMIEKILTACGAAYRVIDRKTIAPIGSDAEAKTIARAFADVSRTEFRGARAHLSTAADALSSGDYASCIRESIHAVEAVARILEPTATTLEPALRALERASKVHPALRLGFSKLYGFTNDEQGIRHALLDEPASPVDETDAIYMFGACASFVSYLIGKTRLS